MSRRRSSHVEGHKSSFSFLDTLICTMGVLLVLLHAFARHGDEKVSKELAEIAAREAEDAGPELEGLQWDIEQLKASRAKTEQQLIEEGQKLSHVEDHQRRLRERFNQLRIAVDEMQRLDPNAKRQHEQDELADLQAKIRDAKEALDEARKKSQQAATYSVVPYEGPNSTRRRPIYIECRGDAIVLQPEGVVLNPEDFAGFTGPGNPLASALRGMQEYWSRQAPGAKQAEPYPLLLVRPEGIEGYYVARAALDTFGAEFGYELIGSDWKLAFPEADPQLAKVTEQVVADARLRQRDYLASTAQLQRNRSRPSYRASPRGGFVQERGSGTGSGSGPGGGGGGGWDDPGSNWTRRGGSSISGRGNGGGFGSESGAGGSGLSGNAPQESYAGTRGAAGGNTLEGSRGGGSFTSRGGDQAKSGKSGATDRYGNPLDGSGGEGEGDSADGSLFGSSGGSPGSTGDSQAAGGSQSQNGSKTAGSFNAQGTNGAAGAARGSSAQANGRSQGGSASGGSSGSSGEGSSSPQGVSAGTPNFDPTSTVQSQKTVSMSKTRGRDWGLPDGGAGRESPATRPIKVECHNDRLVILPESKNQLPKEIPLPGKAQDSMDEFVTGVWQHMKSWGTAGRGLYWRPTLVMEVKPGAADRYAEVKALLADSGLDVHERQTPPTANKTPQKNRR